MIRSFVAQVGDNGRITIAGDVRHTLSIEKNDFVKIDVERLDLFTHSTHRFYDPNREGSTVSRQVSVTNFKSHKLTREGNLPGKNKIKKRHKE